MTQLRHELMKFTRLFSSCCEGEKPLAPLTTMGVGGKAAVFCKPASLEEFAAVLVELHRRNLPWVVLGGGSNVVVLDAGVPGVVVSTRGLQVLEVKGDRLVAEAGVTLQKLVSQAAATELSGLEFCAGIPGTLGGALAQNAGWKQYELAELVQRVWALAPDGRVHSLRPDESAFGYRTSLFKTRPWIALKAELKLTPSTRDLIRSRQQVFQSERRATQPVGKRSAGSVFKNPPDAAAGKLLEEAGAKALALGKVRVSRLHANFLLAEQGATAGEVVELMHVMARLVHARFGLWLEPEIELVGAPRIT